ncbi:hypothetical protein M0Q28_00025 [Patescibacteria group bacterium]|jgi:hypothetical protein|nr:hypothetical protein [Patescibacteria group bacterium]
MSDLPTTPKKTVRRKKAGSTPIPTGPGSTGPTCGHDGNCTTNACAVTYAGPVSRLHDHHMITAARGTTHIWPAAVITSLALLVTGTVAFYSVDAAQDQRTSALQKQAANRADIQKLTEQMNRIERMTTDILKTVKPEPTAEAMLKKMDNRIEDIKNDGATE